jgi:nicotinate-nucleotide adenylyltransferase
MNRRVGILGGTLDPIHCGHLDLGAAVQRALQLTSLLVIPANVPPHRPRPVASGFHRFAMVALAVAGRSGWQASDLELAHETPSYTSTTLLRLRERGYHPAELFFVIGADAFAEIRSWKDYPQILEETHFAVVSRPRCPVDGLRERLPELAPRMVHQALDGTLGAGLSIFLIDAPTADVSSTAIRQRRLARLPISGMVAPNVEQHIEQHGLYTSTTSDRSEHERLTNTTAGRLHGQS